MDALVTMYTIKQVSEMTGMSQSWIRKEVQTGNFPHYRLGDKKRVMITPRHVSEYLASREEGVTTKE